MYVLVSIDEHDDVVEFAGAFSDKDAAVAALPKVVSGVSVNNEEGDPVKFDENKHEIELESCDELELAFGDTPTEQLEVIVDFGDDSGEEDSAVSAGYYLIGFGTAG
jgi:hypothetical protein